MFPEDITIEILARLDVLSLLKFRRVSKAWCNLMSSKDFVKTHVKYSTNNLTHHRIVSRAPSSKLRFWSVSSLLHAPVNVDYYTFLGIPLQEYRLVGCCNGLVCLFNNTKEFFLWNPSTTISRKLPYIGEKVNFLTVMSGSKPKNSRITEYGFGFDKLNSDYKIFAICSCDDDDGLSDIEKHVAQVYSLKANCWKIIEVRPFELDDVCLNVITEELGLNVITEELGLNGKGSFANGKLYWTKRIFAHEERCTFRRVIVSFDFESELQENVEQPNVDIMLLQIGVIDGCLCGVYCGYGKSSHVDIWMLKQDAKNNPSWDIVLRRHCRFGNLGKFGKFRNPVRTLLCITQDGEFLYLDDLSFMTYDTKSNVTRRRLATNLNPKENANQIFLYIPSLVSPYESC